jgi:hypothetical protein
MEHYALANLHHDGAEESKAEGRQEHDEARMETCRHGFQKLWTASLLLSSVRERSRI